MDWKVFIVALSAFEREQLRNALINEECGTSGLTSFEMQLVVTGKIVDAIKSVRARCEVPLKEARDIVYRYKDSR